jgi:hypothetical protein
MDKETKATLKEISKLEIITRNELLFILHNCFNSKGYDMATSINAHPSYLVDVINYRKTINKDLSDKILAYCSKNTKRTKKANLQT